MSISGFVVLFTIVAIPSPGFNCKTEPALATVLTVTPPVPPLNVTFPPARTSTTPVFPTVTFPVGVLIDTAVPAITASIPTSIDPGKFTKTLALALAAVASPV